MKQVMTVLQIKQQLWPNTPFLITVTTHTHTVCDVELVSCDAWRPELVLRFTNRNDLSPFNLLKLKCIKSLGGQN